MQDVKTLAGRLTARQVITLQDIHLLEFDKNHQISQQKVLVFDHDDYKYDIIFGTNFLSKVGIKLNYNTGLMQWCDVALPLHPQRGIDSKEIDAMEDMYNNQLEDKLFGKDWLQCYATHILDARYEFTDVKDVIDQLTHHNSQQKADLLQVLMENAQMFDGKLGVYPHKKVYLELDPNAKPVNARLYPVSHIHLSTFKKELDHLVALGVLIPQKESEWASPTFIIPKKDG